MKKTPACYCELRDIARDDDGKCIPGLLEEITTIVNNTSLPIEDILKTIYEKGVHVKGKPEKLEPLQEGIENLVNLYPQDDIEDNEEPLDTDSTGELILPPSPRALKVNELLKKIEKTMPIYRSNI